MSLIQPPTGFDGLSPESIVPLLSPFRSLPITVAFSGGMDSMVLLHLLVALRERDLLSQLKAVHVHHGLSDFADRWANFCQTVCQRWQVPLSLAKVSVPENMGGGIEQAARQCRYQVFEQQVHSGGCLVMGHHQDDQAETLLLRLFRGTGLEGLQGMPQQRKLGQGELLRPLLSVPRQQIEDYARYHQLKWVEDESNQDQRFSRNFLRQGVIPEIERRWPGASGRIARLTTEVGDAFQKLHLQVAEALEQCQERRSLWWLDNFTQLNTQLLKRLESTLQKQVFRLWLKENAGSVLGRNELDKLFDELIDASIDAEPQRELGNKTLRRFRGRLYITSRTDRSAHKVQSWNWQDNASIQLEDSLLLLRHRTFSEDGLKVILPDRPLQILRREHIPAQAKIAVAGRAGRKTVKRWLQEYHLPPWCRQQQPFLYDGENMVAAPGLWVCQKYQGTSADRAYTLNCASAE